MSELLRRLQWQRLPGNLARDAVELVVLSRARRLLGGFARQDWPSEAVVVVLDVDLASGHMAEFRRGKLVLLECRLRDGVEVSRDVVSSRGRLALGLLVRLGVRVVQVDLDFLLFGRLSELPRAYLGSLLELDVEAIMPIVRARGRLQLVLDELARVLLAPGRHALEHVRSRRSRGLWPLWVVLPDAWVRLLEVNVDRYGLHVVQRVLLVEGQTEVAFGIEPRGWHMLFDRVRVVLSRRRLNVRINRQHVGKDLEAVLVADEAIQHASRRDVLQRHLLVEVLVGIVGAGAWFAVEVLLQLEFSVKAALLHSEIHLPPHLLACVGKR